MTSVTVWVIIGLLLIAPLVMLRVLPHRRTWRRAQIVLKLLAPVAAVLPIFVGLLQFVDSQKERTASTTRAEYIQATQMLSENDQAKQLAGIAAIAQLAADDPVRTWLMTESLSAFVRIHAQRSDAEIEQERLHVLAPVEEPPCQDWDPPEYKFRYSSCQATRKMMRPLYRTNPAVQAAISALAVRNRENEDLDDVPPRFRPQVQAANRDWPTGWWGRLIPRPAPPTREATLAYIRDNWLSKRRTDSNGQLIAETQVANGGEYPEIGSRPWLNLSHAELSGAEADSAFFEGGNLRHTNLSFASLAGAALAKASLADSWLIGANLFASDLRGANLEYVDTRGADFGRSDLRRAWMSGGTFRRANFWQAQLTGAYLIATNMTDVETMSGSQMDDIVAYRADFTDANVSGDGEYRICMRRAYFKEAKLTRAKLRGVDLRAAELQGTDLTGASLAGADLRGAMLDEAFVNDLELDFADLRGVDFSRTKGTPRRIRGTLISSSTVLPSGWQIDKAERVDPSTSTRSDVENCTAQRAPAERERLFSRQ